MRIYHRHLPHWRQEGVAYAVTFRLGDALPQTKLQELKRHRERWEQANPGPRDESRWKAFAKEVTSMTEHWMDEGYGECHFRVQKNAVLIGDALRFYEDTKCSVPCFTVMPNHIHAIMMPRTGYELEAILKTIKGWVSRQINLRSVDIPVRAQPQSSAGLWAQESYDRIIRDEDHLYRVVQYIGRNGKSSGTHFKRIPTLDQSAVASSWMGVSRLINTNRRMDILVRQYVGLLQTTDRNVHPTNDRRTRRCMVMGNHAIRT